MEFRSRIHRSRAAKLAQSAAQRAIEAAIAKAPSVADEFENLFRAAMAAIR
jgi:hypothetical protein